MTDRTATTWRHLATALEALRSAYGACPCGSVCDHIQAAETSVFRAMRSSVGEQIDLDMIDRREEPPQCEPREICV